ncbi:MAG TPA: aspartyl protease family protein [Pyrinomonadaceae bacterium]|nr:aspartyl protease family protein [Pyrinomonadaceae bacterium]
MKSEVLRKLNFPLLLLLPPSCRRTKIVLTGLAFAFFCLAATPAAVPADADTQQIEPGNARQAVRQAEKLVRKGQLLEAEKLLRRVVQQNPADSKAKIKLAFVLMKRKHLVEAYDYAVEVAKNEPKNAYAFAVLGATLLNAGNFKQAALCFVNALKLDKGEALAWAGLGLLDYYENRIDKSLEFLKAAEDRDPQEADYVFARAQVSARAERYKEAAEAYDRFLQISQDADDERRARIKGLINFLRFLGNKQALYIALGEEKTTVPVRLLRDRPVIEVKIGKHNEPLRFVLDTGSGISVISEEVSRRLDIKPITKGGLARAVGGNGKFQIVYGFLRQISIGEVKIQNVPVYIRKFHENDEKIDGYIGLGLISKFLTTLDYGALTFSLVRRSGIEETAATTAAESGNLPSQPLRLTSSGYLSGEVQLEGIETPLNFIVDTGASVSVISQEVAALNEVNKYISSEKMRVVGAAGVTEGVSAFLLPRVTFGNHTREKIKAIALDLDIINETSGFEQAGILGGNFLKNYRLTFDFKNSRVTFEPVASGVGGALKPE